MLVMGSGIHTGTEADAGTLGSSFGVREDVRVMEG